MEGRLPRRPQKSRQSKRRAEEKPLCSNNSHGETAATPSPKNREVTQSLRKHPAHLPVIVAFNRSVIVFVTVCAKDRHPVLAVPTMHDWLRRAWEMADTWRVGRYVIMPDHVHLFCAPGVWPPMPIKKWVEYWKGIVARAAKGYGPLIEEMGWGGTQPSKSSQPSKWAGVLWQRDFWDTQLRHGESYAKKWQYVRANPVRAGLCEVPEDWLYQGEMNVLAWHD